MSKKHHSQFSLDFNHLIRFVIFIGLCYLAITYLNPQSQPKINFPSISYPIPKDLPSAVNQLTSTITTFISEIPNFINQTIIDLKKELVTQVYQDIIQSIDKK